MKKLLILLLLPMLVFASGDDDDGAIATATAGADAAATAGATATATGGNLIGGDLIGGDTSISTGGNRAFAFSHSLGDVDINECIVTKQTGTFVISWQGYDYNVWCMGEVYDAKGLYDMAALMRCDVPLVRGHFSTDAECLVANTMPMVSVATAPPAAPPVEVVASSEYRERESEHEGQFEGLVDRINKMEAEKDANVRRYNRDQAEQATLKQADREYAQQTLDDLAEYRTNEPQ